MSTNFGSVSINNPSGIPDEVWNSFSPTLRAAAGKIPETLLNDLVLHSVMQHSNMALKGFVCALLEIAPETVDSVELMNPIDFSDSFSGKEVILDIKANLTNREIINIEVQAYHDTYYPRRATIYLGRAYDSLEGGEDYRLLKKTTHISIVTEPLFPANPEFYAKFKLMNVRTHEVFNEQIALNVLDLSQLIHINESSDPYHLFLWARLFLAEDWDEVRRIAAENPYCREAIEMMSKINADVHARSIAEAHRKYLEVKTTRDHEIEDMRETIIRQSEALIRQKEELAEKDSALTEKDSALAEKDSALVEKDSALAEKDTIIAELRQKLASLEKGN